MLNNYLDVSQQSYAKGVSFRLKYILFHKANGVIYLFNRF